MIQQSHVHSRYILNRVFSRTICCIYYFRWSSFIENIRTEYKIKFSHGTKPIHWITLVLYCCAMTTTVIKNSTLKNILDWNLNEREILTWKHKYMQLNVNGFLFISVRIKFSETTPRTVTKNRITITNPVLSVREMHTSSATRKRNHQHRRVPLPYSSIVLFSFIFMFWIRSAIPYISKSCYEHGTDRNESKLQNEEFLAITCLK